MKIRVLPDQTSRGEPPLAPDSLDSFYLSPTFASPPTSLFVDSRAFTLHPSAPSLDLAFTSNSSLSNCPFSLRFITASTTRTPRRVHFAAFLHCSRIIKSKVIHKLLSGPFTAACSKGLPPVLHPLALRLAPRNPLSYYKRKFRLAQSIL
ncbi:hypothetical protein LZ554_006080 [Drepanopeziza brunnea f. sp. 'monogermtubi']|nr:hypothetical protein LZ554_006080 [Drepanopeziza brunnea f. sp. 'monogermtubi']